MSRLFLVRVGSIFILSLCFSMSVLASEDLKAGEKEQKNKEIKLLYKQAIIDYKHDRLYESQKAFKKILELDEGQRKAGYFLEERIPRKLVEREAKKQESLRVEQIKAFYLEKKKARQAAQEAGGKNAGGLCERKSHVDNVRSLFANDDVM